MEVSKVTLEDGRRCAQLIRAINAAKFDGLSGADIEAFVVSKKWLQEIAMKMAEQLKPVEPEKKVETPSPAHEPKGGFRVKSMGQLPTKSPRKKK